MNNSVEKHTETEPMNIEYILASLRDILPSAAKELIASTHDPSDPLEQGFIDNPDSPSEHSPMWHQHGVLTHSEMFRKFMAEDAPKLMEKWGISEKTEALLSEKIDGLTKADLLQIVSLLHDLGKFTARTFEYKEDGSMLARFVGHEEYSGAIIRTRFNDKLKELGLSEAQIEYIALCAEHHFDLGRAREIAKDNGGYTMTFAMSESFKQVALDIVKACPDQALEIGLMFMADSLSKTEVKANAFTDEGIESQRPDLEQEIKDKNLDPRLINQALQQPVNMVIGERYLQVWAGLPDTLSV